MPSRFTGLAAAVAAAFSLAGPALAVPIDFEGEEYHESGALDVINASDAYALGYTGKGQTIGILDTAVRIDHPELAGKAETMPLYVNGQAVDPVWDSNTMHGSHVAGIAAAKRDDSGMHGVAFDADIWAGALLGDYDHIDLPQYFAACPEARIFNNSWGSTTYDASFDASGNEVSLESFISNILMQDQETTYIARYAQAHPQSVFVFAAGNNGQMAPNFSAVTPRFLGVGNLANWISVGAINANNGCIVKKEDGTLLVKEAGVPWFTNLAKGSELLTVMAPGSNIYSLKADTNGYMLDSGTSMAAPVVSGALALVAQAYPWMSGKQLADAVLTTANMNFEAPSYTVAYSIDNFNPYQGRFGTVRLVIIAEDKQQAEKIKESGSATIDGKEVHLNAEANNAEDLRELLQKQIEQDPSAWIGGDRYALQALEQGAFAIEVLTKEEVFGQGILDVGKAVHGIARLDANRLAADNVVFVDELNEYDAIEAFDTKGLSAEFSNDISERRWDDDYHHSAYRTDGTFSSNAAALKDQKLGLLKAGSGTLILSGTNTYAGATIVEGGVLAVAKREDETGGVLKNSNVVVRRSGTLMGDGAIDNKLVNNGTVLPGWRGDTLTVGSYEQGEHAVLGIIFDAQGGHAALAVTGTARLDGTLSYMPQRNVFYKSGRYALKSEALTAAQTEGNFSRLTAQTNSPTLTATLVDAGDAALGSGAVIEIDRAANAYSKWAQTSTQASVGSALAAIAQTSGQDMQQLISVLDWSDADGRSVANALRVLGPDAYARAGQTDLIEQNELNASILSHMLGGRLEALRHRTEQDALWVKPFRTDSRQGITSIGLMAGFDRTVQEGLTLGAHFAASERKTEVETLGSTESESRGAFVGAQALYGPQDWNGAYVASGLRLGLQDVEMQREASFAGYAANFKSDWTQVSGSAFFAAGKDWAKTSEKAAALFGPIAWAEYAFAKRPEVKESGAGAAALHAQAETYDSLIVSAGLRAAVRADLDDQGSTASVELLTAWRHELLDDAYRTQACFAGYGAHPFSGQSYFQDRDALMVQTGVLLAVQNNFRLRLDVGGEFFRDDSSGVNFGLTLGWAY